MNSTQTAVLLKQYAEKFRFIADSINSDLVSTNTKKHKIWACTLIDGHAHLLSEKEKEKSPDWSCSNGTAVCLDGLFQALERLELDIKLLQGNVDADGKD